MVKSSGTYPLMKCIVVGVNMGLSDPASQTRGEGVPTAAYYSRSKFSIANDHLKWYSYFIMQKSTKITVVKMKMRLWLKSSLPLSTQRGRGNRAAWSLSYGPWHVTPTILKAGVNLQRWKMKTWNANCARSYIYRSQYNTKLLCTVTYATGKAFWTSAKAWMTILEIRELNL